MPLYPNSLIPVLGAGVAGVAIPTLISRIVAAVIMFVLSLNHKNDVYVKIKDMKTMNMPMMKKILQIAIPNGIENGLLARNATITAPFTMPLATALCPVKVSLQECSKAVKFT